MNNKHIICGKNSVLDALKAKIKIKKIWTLKPLDFKTNVEVEIVSRNELDQITNLNHQGIIAFLEQGFNYHDINKIIKKQPKIVLILDHIEDPHNLGAILRSANAAGIQDIIIPDKRASLVNDTVLKVSSGGFNNLNIAKVNSLQVIVEKLKNNGYWIYATAIEKGSDYSKVKYNFPLAIIVGNEAKGVSNTLLKMSDQNIFIPMFGTVQSLNVSVATGILLFEIIKQNV